MNKTRLKLYPENFPTLESIKHEELEKLSWLMSVHIPSDYQHIEIIKSLDLIDMANQLDNRTDFFHGRDIRFGNTAKVVVNYYLFNDRVSFTFYHETKLPECPTCKRKSLYMRPDGSFWCNREDCSFHLPVPVQYHQAMEELTRMKLREQIGGILPMRKQKIIIEQDLVPYVLAIFRELEIKVTKHSKLMDEQYEIYIDLKKGFDIKTIDAVPSGMV